MQTADVAIVGAGLAGLSAVTLLADQGLDVVVWEAADDVGGRVRTDEVDGFRLDRGFQVLLPSYPEVRRQIDLPALRPQPFFRGLMLRDGVRSVVLGDPIGATDALAGLVPGRALRAADLARLAALTARDRLAVPSTLVAGPERSTRDELRARGLSAHAIDGVLAPLLRGIFLEEDLATSARFFHLVWRSFASRAPVLPAEGMAALPRQLAARLRPGTVRLGCPADIVTRGGVRSRGGESLRARVVIVATDGTTAARLGAGDRRAGLARRDDLLLPGGRTAAAPRRARRRGLGRRAAPRSPVPNRTGDQHGGTQRGGALVCTAGVRADRRVGTGCARGHAARRDAARPA
ncbi:FAD-dependent oxidoreductase [Candidatus Frankia alpina]|uniref:FAD-dependent oxidoreductase n=1 Tax=Candidatus Frankia alpina TaxID=2699483 RepID=A0A4S5ESN7_9ACTN|nr:FAD-dependent oxidoreductase [Candidatus Frankia alpina]THJ75283.1 FAD-dependent oxidoreductase [Candidatus Frankia alpina]